ncbi:LptA/OstA family protein [Acidicapsa dinghuensis]|uniref:LptA/OstA family protein n=1 Tax=Acidicapsa dinghuensis TaxID=2218256 RepID=A0ABW1EKH7_9BACT|nr:LptA/OstA family protein [Acidicapsa dinghuensis]
MSVATSKPRITIERLRTLVLIGGVLLVLVIAAVLIGGKWVRRYIEKDIPGRLGINIVQQADGVDYSQTRKGKTIFKIHANRAIKHKSDGSAVLQDVRIELYGEDGTRTDTISGKEFEYNPSQGIATAAGEVEITMVRPGEKPAVAKMPMPGLKTKAGSKGTPQGANKSGAAHGSAAGNSAASTNPGLHGLPQAITDEQIHVTTSGLVFHQKEGIATTTQHVDFALRQGSGSANGATYDSQNGSLVLDHDVQIHVQRNAATAQAPVNIYAAHAEFEHDAMTCLLTDAKADSNGDNAQSGYALLYLRDDGSISKLDGSKGVTLKTEKGGLITAPNGTLDFDAENHPAKGVLQGGTKFGLTQPDRTVEGTSPVAHLTFDKQGQLSQAHLEQGVEFHSRQQSVSAKNVPVVVTRTWKSQTADISFAPQPSQTNQSNKNGQRQANASSAHVEARTVQGNGGVTVTSETTSNGVSLPSRLSADALTAELGSDHALSELNASGRVSFDERGVKGDHDSGSSDQLEVHFFPAGSPQGKSGGKTTSGGGVDASQVASIVQTGHVILIQDAAARDGRSSEQTSVRAVAERSEYNGSNQMVYLSGSPRVRDGGMDIAADRIDLSRASGDGLARGNVRISWVSAGTSGTAAPGSSLLGNRGSDSGANDPLNAVAAEAELHKSTQEVVLHGGSGSSDALHGDVRLWQGVNSVAAPVITLNRQKQTLDAQAGGVDSPVKTVLMGSLGNALSTPRNSNKGSASPGAKSSDAPSLIRVRSGSLHYSDGEHLAVFQSGLLPNVVAQATGSDGLSTILAQQVDVTLTPRSSASHASAQGNATHEPQRSIDHLVATGKVRIDWPDRRGTGEQLVYRGEDGTFTLTGSATVPPRITDEVRGSISGKALVYHSRDASVTVEGDGGKTVTDTRSKK